MTYTLHRKKSSSNRTQNDKTVTSFYGISGIQFGVSDLFTVCHCVQFGVSLQIFLQQENFGPLEAFINPSHYPKTLKQCVMPIIGTLVVYRRRLIHVPTFSFAACHLVRSLRIGGWCPNKFSITDSARSTPYDVRLGFFASGIWHICSSWGANPIHIPCQLVTKVRTLVQRSNVAAFALSHWLSIFFVWSTQPAYLKIQTKMVVDSLTLKFKLFERLCVTGCFMGAWLGVSLRFPKTPAAY